MRVLGHGEMRPAVWTPSWVERVVPIATAFTTTVTPRVEVLCG